MAYIVGPNVCIMDFIIHVRREYSSSALFLSKFLAASRRKSSTVSEYLLLSFGIFTQKRFHDFRY